MTPALQENRFARDQRGQLFDLATGRDVPDRVQEETRADLPVGRLDALVRAVADVLEAGGPRVRVLALEALEADRQAGEHEDDCVAAEAGRRGFVPISLAGLRRLPAPGVLARRSALVMARRPSTPGANALAEGSAVLLALSALRAKPMAVVATRATADEVSSAAASEPDGDRVVGGTLVSRTGPARVWQVAECSPVVSGSARATNRARSLRKMQALCGFHRRRGDWRAFLDASLWLSRLHLEREAPDDCGRVAHDARTWRAWWTDPSGVSVAAIARVLALLDVEACARLSSRDFDGSTSVEGVHAGAWVAEALGLRELKPRLSIHLAAIERRAGRLDAALRALGTPESTTPQTALDWSRESLWTALACGNWPEAGRAAQQLRELMTCAAASSVKGPAALELATFHLGIGDEGTARAVLAAQRDSLHALRGSDRVRHALVRKALGLPAPVVAPGARGDARPASGPGPWGALRRDYAALVHRRAPARLVNAPAQGGAVTRTECLRRTNGTGECVMEDVLDLLRACHDAEDDQGGLGRMCLLVRERLGALAVGVWAAPHAEPLAGSGSGRHWPISLAERARTTGLPHGPEATGTAVEAAWPVTHAGAPIGALACRWLIDQPIDRARTEVMLSAAAAACVPLVRGTIDAKVQARSASGQPAFGLVGDSEAMQELRGGIQRAALAPFHVLIEGESGSGKELVARAIHEASPRRHKRFCAVNCAALTDELLEAELFGHTRGAFTGALAERAGLFEAASGGTLFLDEVADLSPRGQAKVLRVLQDGEVRRVGENFSRRVDVRVVAATNKALRDEVGRGRFRQDLRYRLDVLRLTIPALRERRSDVVLLATHFWQDAAARMGSRAVLDGAVLAALSRYDWPGNVRELQNVMATVAVHAPVRGRVGLAALPRAVGSLEEAVPVATLEEARRRFEAQYVRNALARAGGCRAQAARSLGLTRQGFAKLVERLGVGPEAINSP